MTDDERRARMEKALQYGGGTHGIDDVVQLVKQNRAQFWSNGDGCIVTEVEQYPLLTMVRYWLIFGELKDCLALEDQINEWAIGEGYGGHRDGAQGLGARRCADRMAALPANIL